MCELKTTFVNEKEKIQVDACIADAVSYLWQEGIVTTACCCGHGKTHPYIMVDEAYSDKDCKKILNMLCDFEQKNWEIQQWTIQTFKKENE